MNKHDFYIISDDIYFPQQLYAWEAIDVVKIKKELEKAGFKVIITSFEEVVNDVQHISNSYIYYASSQIPERKEYIEDALLGLMMDDKNILLPKFEIFRAHENKGFQEIYKKKVGITELNSAYYIDSSALDNLADYPKVIKTVNGYGSKGVWLIKNFKQAKKLYIQKIRKKASLLNLKTTIKELFFRKKYGLGHIKYKKDCLERRFVVQNLIPNLTYDYKVLVFGNKFYVLRRHIKKNDFRASGSGFWEFPEINDFEDGLLDFAKECYEKLDIPFVSLDICSGKSSFFLIEFQGLHFGTVTLTKSKGYYQKENSTWIYVEEKPCFEREIANSLLVYLKNSTK